MSGNLDDKIVQNWLISFKVKYETFCLLITPTISTTIFFNYYIKHFRLQRISKDSSDYDIIRDSESFFLSLKCDKETGLFSFFCRNGKYTYIPQITKAI